MWNIKSIFSVLLLLVGGSLLAQNPEPVEMADLMRSNGKIYVVVAVLALVFIVITAYLVIIDRKIGKLEKDTNS